MATLRIFSQMNAPSTPAQERLRARHGISSPVDIGDVPVPVGKAVAIPWPLRPEALADLRRALEAGAVSAHLVQPSGQSIRLTSKSPEVEAAAASVAEVSSPPAARAVREPLTSRPAPPTAPREAPVAAVVEEPAGWGDLLLAEGGGSGPAEEALEPAAVEPAAVEPAAVGEAPSVGGEPAEEALEPSGGEVVEPPLDAPVGGIRGLLGDNGEAGEAERLKVFLALPYPKLVATFQANFPGRPSQGAGRSRAKLAAELAELPTAIMAGE